MILKRFTFLTTLRIVLLIGNVILIAFIFGDKRLFFNQVILGIVSVSEEIGVTEFMISCVRIRISLCHASISFCSISELMS